MRRPGGYLVVHGPDGMEEADTFTCAHCNRVIVVRAGADPSELGGYCTLCSANVCPSCAGRECTPFEKRLEAVERRRALLSSLD